MIVSSATGAWARVAALRLESNAPPSVGDIVLNLNELPFVQQSSALTVGAIGFTDNIEQMPLEYRFGYY